MLQSLLIRMNHHCTFWVVEILHLFFCSFLLPKCSMQFFAKLVIKVLAFQKYQTFVASLLGPARSATFGMLTSSGLLKEAV